MVLVVKGGVKSFVKKNLNTRVSKRSILVVFLLLMTVSTISSVILLTNPPKMPQSQVNIVKVAVMDTGISLVSEGLKQHVKGGIDLVANASYCTVTSNPKHWGDRIGHGTYVASLIIEARNYLCLNNVEFELQIFSLRLNFGEGFADMVTNGITWCTENGIDILHASIGFAHQPIIQETIKHAYESGILLVAAAGNNGEAGVEYPGRYDEFMAVGISSNCSVIDNSSRGEEIELVAPGYITLENSKGSRTTIGGTSFSAPIVTGLAAILLGLKPELTNEEVRTILRESATDIPPEGVDAESGWGQIDVLKAVEMAISDMSVKLEDLKTGVLNMGNLIPIIHVEKLIGEIETLGESLSKMVVEFLLVTLCTCAVLAAGVLRIRRKLKTTPPPFCFQD